MLVLSSPPADNIDDNPGGRLPVLPAWPAVIFPATGYLPAGILISVATSLCRGHVDELATEPFLLLHREHETGYWRNWNCCDQRTCFVVIWENFCFILSAGTRIRIDSAMWPRCSSRGRNTSASVSYSSIILTAARVPVTANCVLVCLQEAELPRPLKRSSGIPNSFMEPVRDMNQPGAMLTSSGQLAVPTIDAYV